MIEIYDFDSSEIVDFGLECFENGSPISVIGFKLDFLLRLKLTSHLPHLPLWSPNYLRAA